MKPEKLIGSREIKFRVPVECQNGCKSFWFIEQGDDISEFKDVQTASVYKSCECPKFNIGEGWRRAGYNQQYTGLKDKNGLTYIYECDIIGSDGEIKGNTYEMDAGETDLVIQGFGTKDWFETYNEAVARGCRDS